MGRQKLMEHLGGQGGEGKKDGGLGRIPYHPSQPARQLLFPPTYTQDVLPPPLCVTSPPPMCDSPEPLGSMCGMVAALRPPRTSGQHVWHGGGPPPPLYLWGACVAWWRPSPPCTSGQHVWHGGGPPPPMLPALQPADIRFARLAADEADDASSGSRPRLRPLLRSSGPHGRGQLALHGAQLPLDAPVRLQLVNVPLAVILQHLRYRHERARRRGGGQQIRGCACVGREKKCGEGKTLCSYA